MKRGSEESESSNDKRLKQIEKSVEQEKDETLTAERTDIVASTTSDIKTDNKHDPIPFLTETKALEEQGDAMKITEKDEGNPGDGDHQSLPEKENNEQSFEEKKDQGRWQLTPVNAKQRMNYILSTCSLSDCTFLIGKEDVQEFKLHAVILSMSSPEFEDLLGESTTVTIADVEPDIFKQILEYIYLDYINLWSVEKTQALYRASSKLKLPHLSEKAVEFLMDKMNLESIWPIFEAAIDTQDMFLIDECSKFFKKNIAELLKHPKFRKVDPSVLYNLVEDDNLGVVEVDLVNGIQQWASQRCADMELVPSLENKRAVLGSQIIPNLRFLALTRETFVNQFAYNKQKSEEGILTMDESYAILMNLVVPESHPMPEGFSLDIKQRSTADRRKLNRRIFNPLGTYYNQNLKGVSRMDRLTVYTTASMAAPIGAKNFSLELTVNRAVILHGIQLPTFESTVVGSLPKEYEETYVVTVQNISKQNKPVMSSITWSGRVAYNSVMDITFKDYIKFEKNVKYSILVYTSNMYYINQKLCTVEEAGPVKFVFKDSVSLYGKSATPDFGFVSQLVYTPL